MAIKIKRSSGNLAPESLAAGQLAYSEGSTNGGTLYYGEIGGTVREIAGKKFVDKLDGIEAGAEVNTVTSVFGRDGAVTLEDTDVTGALGFTPEDAANKGEAGGYASLDESGLVPSSQLPSYVDDVLEYNNLAGFPATGVTGKIYVAIDTSKTYRWSGSTYVEISASPGSTDSVTEGSTNLYFTNSRARSAISVTDSGGDGSVSYNDSTGVITYTGPSASDVRAHFSAGTGISITDGAIATTITQYTDSAARSAVSATDAGGDGSFSYSSSTGAFTYTGPGTSDYRAAFSAGTGITITNGVVATTVTQFTASDAKTALSVTDAGGDGSLSYNDSTGVFTYTGPSASDVRAHFSAGTGITITDGVVATTITQGISNVVEDTSPQLGGNLDLNGNSITSASDADVVIDPNGTGNVYLNTDTVRVGDLNSDAMITTHGTGDMILNTNSGTNSGSITIADGTNGNITIAPNGTGATILGAGGGGVISQISTATSSALASSTLRKTRTDVARASMDGVNVAQAFQIRDNTNANWTFARINAVYNSTVDSQTMSLQYGTNGTSTAINYLVAAPSTVTLGDSTTAATSHTITTGGSKDLVLNTNSGTNSGAITINDGSSGAIEIEPASSGKVVIDGLSWPTADGTSAQVLTTDGSGNLSWATQSSGVTAFTGLTDVPSSFTGSAGYYVKVNSGASALEFSQDVDDGTF